MNEIGNAEGSSERPSEAYLSMVATGARDLRGLMARGQQPDPANLVGWEFRGTNLPARTALLGLRRFIKGFCLDGSGSTIGYNKSVAGADLGTPWTPRAQRDGRVAWAYYTVAPVDPEAPDNRHLNALLLDYGAVPEPERGIAGRLRDYLVRVEPGSDDLLLGRAFAAVGRSRLQIGWFVLERLQPIPEPAEPLPWENS
jgi:hypothetical protein